MSLLETVVFRDVVEVVSADNNGSLHLGGDDSTLEDTSADGNSTYVDLVHARARCEHFFYIPVHGHFLSMKFPSMASRGVLKPKPMFLK